MVMWSTPWYPILRFHCFGFHQHLASVCKFKEKHQKTTNGTLFHSLPSKLFIPVTNCLRNGYSQFHHWKENKSITVCYWFSSIPSFFRGSQLSQWTLGLDDCSGNFRLLMESGATTGTRARPGRGPVPVDGFPPGTARLEGYCLERPAPADLLAGDQRRYAGARSHLWPTQRGLPHPPGHWNTEPDRPTGQQCIALA